MALTKSINRQLCENVKVVMGRHGCFLQWEERHRELVTELEWITGVIGRREATEAWLNAPPDPMGEREKRREYRRLYETLPSREFELPLTRIQAFALVAACYCRSQGAAVRTPSVFAAEIEALL